MPTLPTRRRLGREAQARYEARRREAGRPSRAQVLQALEAGVQATVEDVLAMEAGPEKTAAHAVLKTLMQRGVQHLERLPWLDPTAIRTAVKVAATGTSCSGRKPKPLM